MHRSSRSERPWLVARPNTGLPDRFIQDDFAICAGEDEADLVAAMPAAIPSEWSEINRHRCYVVAWRYEEPGLTVMLSGIGTGCIEPLIYEVLDPEWLGDRVAKRLVMVGTAGSGVTPARYLRLCGSSGERGRLAATVTLAESCLPLTPSFANLDHYSAAEDGDEVSTDYYYAASRAPTDPRRRKAQQLNQALRDGLDKYWEPGRLISMETAQFYHFASVYGPPGTQFAAFRGIANLAEQFHTQSTHSQPALTNALQHAVALLAV